MIDLVPIPAAQGAAPAPGITLPAEPAPPAPAESGSLKAVARFPKMLEAFASAQPEVAPDEVLPPVAGPQPPQKPQPFSLPTMQPLAASRLTRLALLADWQALPPPDMAQPAPATDLVPAPMTAEDEALPGMFPVPALAHMPLPVPLSGASVAPGPAPVPAALMALPLPAALAFPAPASAAMPTAPAGVAAPAALPMIAHPAASVSVPAAAIMASSLAIGSPAPLQARRLGPDSSPVAPFVALAMQPATGLAAAIVPLAQFPTSTDPSPTDLALPDPVPPDPVSTMPASPQALPAMSSASMPAASISTPSLSLAHVPSGSPPSAPAPHDLHVGVDEGQGAGLSAAGPDLALALEGPRGPVRMSLSGNAAALQLALAMPAENLGLAQARSDDLSQSLADQGVRLAGLSLSASDGGSDTDPRSDARSDTRSDHQGRSQGEPGERRSPAVLRASPSNALGPRQPDPASPRTRAADRFA